MSPRFTLVAHSTALFSTWWFVDELRLLFDAGDGVMATLQHKSRRVRHVAISHADRDHIMGLPQFVHHNAHEGLEAVFYPADSVSMPAMRAFCDAFDPHTAERAEWRGVRPGEGHALAKDLVLRPVANRHVERPDGGVRSVGYVVNRSFRKLRREFFGLSGEVLAELGRVRGSEALSEPREEPVLGYSGDTGVLPPDRWAGCPVLIHEATFLSVDERAELSPDDTHSALPDVLRMARDAGPQALVLGHFSSRYKAGEVREAVRREAGELRLPFPVFALPPGETVWDLLAGEPAWAAGS